MSAIFTEQPYGDAIGAPLDSAIKPRGPATGGRGMPGFPAANLPGGHTYLPNPLATGGEPVGGWPLATGTPMPKGGGVISSGTAPGVPVGGAGAGTTAGAGTFTMPTGTGAGNYGGGAQIVDANNPLVTQFLAQFGQHTFMGADGKPEEIPDSGNMSSAGRYIVGHGSPSYRNNGLGEFAQDPSRVMYFNAQGQRVAQPDPNGYYVMEAGNIRGATAANMQARDARTEQRQSWQGALRTAAEIAALAGGAYMYGPQIGSALGLGEGAAPVALGGTGGVDLGVDLAGGFGVSDLSPLPGGLDATTVVGSAAEGAAGASTVATAADGTTGTINQIINGVLSHPMQALGAVGTIYAATHGGQGGGGGSVPNTASAVSDANSSLLPGATQTLTNNGLPSAAQIQAIDSRITLQRQQGREAILQSAANSGMGGADSMVVQDKFQALDLKLEAMREQEIQQVTQQNIATALSELGLIEGNQLAIANMQIASNQQSQQYLFNILNSMGWLFGQGV